MSLGANTLSPLEIEDARTAAHRASELQRELEDDMRSAGHNLAECEEAYRRALSFRIWELKKDGVAITACENLAKGEEPVVELRRLRDDAKVELEVLRQQAYRRGADRADVGRLLDWSMKRDLRVDTPPGETADVTTFGRRQAA